MPRLNGKFVSKEKYEAAVSNGETVVIPIHQEKVEVVTETERKPRTVDPITSATARVRQAKRELDRVSKIHAKRAVLPSLEDAQAAYDSAVVELQDALNV